MIWPVLALTAALGFAMALYLRPPIAVELPRVVTGQR
jgi:hypothetical protein